MTIRDSQMQGMADASPGKQMIRPCEATWIEIRLVDTKKNPVPNEKYQIRMPDSSLVEGALDSEGKARLEGILPGQCTICFPNIHSKEWKRVG